MDVFAELDGAVAGVGRAAGVELDGLSPAELRRVVCSCQAVVDLTKVLQARALHAADMALAWSGTGSRDAAGWLADATNSSYADAVRQVRLGDALAVSDELAEAVADGSASVATAETIAPTLGDSAVAGIDAGDLLDQVAGAGPREARRIADQWAAASRSREDDDTRRRRAQQARFVRFGRSLDGQTSGSFNMPDVDARSVRQALEHIAGKPSEDDTRSGEQRLADALVALADAYAKGAVTGGRERPSLLLVSTPDVALEHAPGNAVTSFDDVVADADLRRVMCDCIVHRVVINSAGVVLDKGRGARVATHDQWLALVVRDRRCRHPGCTMTPGWCDAHHIIEWTPDGRTDMVNLVLLCRHHHTTIHLPGHTLTGTADHAIFTYPDGRTLHSYLPADQSGQLRLPAA